jgi:hypothetical protein
LTCALRFKEEAAEFAASGIGEGVGKIRSAKIFIALSEKRMFLFGSINLIKETFTITVTN